MNKIKIWHLCLVILIGISLFVYGEIDDSPGGQLMGLLVVIICIVGIFRKKKSSNL